MLNPNEAPEGCYAVEQDNCNGCCFNGPIVSCSIPLDNAARCVAGGREDETDVIFKKKSEVELEVEPELINMQDKYKYANGEEARIVMVDGKHPDLPVVSEDLRGSLFLHNKYGSNSFSPDYTLIKVQPYSEFKKGDKVIAIYKDGSSKRRYFSHVESGKPCCFIEGTDEWSSEGQTAPWPNIRRPTKEELGE